MDGRKFVCIPNAGGQPIYVNPDHVQMVYSAHNTVVLEMHDTNMVTRADLSWVIGVLNGEIPDYEQ